MSKNLQDVMAEALQLHQQGQLNEAERRYRLVLQHVPEFAPALHYLGVIGLQTKHYAAAIPLLQKAHQLVPDDVSILTNFGIALLESGEYAQAIQKLNSAASLSVNNPQILANLGNAYKQTEQYELAIQQYKNALNVNSKMPEVHRNLAISYAAIFYLEHALNSIEQAMELAPDSIETLTTYANILLKSDLPEKAIAQFEKLLEKVSDKAPIKTNLAMALAATNQLQRAKTLAQEAVTEAPDFLDGWLNLINILQEQGCFEEAALVAEQALKKWPQNVNLLTLKFRGYVFTEEDKAEIQCIEELANSPNALQRDTIKLHYLLGKAYEDLSNFASSFSHYAKANEVTEKLTTYELNQDLKAIENIEHAFSAEYLTKLRKLSPDYHLPEDFKPIFVVGMPRSGSTLTEQILASHHLVSGAGELPYLARQLDKTIGLRNSMDSTLNLTSLDAHSIYEIRQGYYDNIQKLNLTSSCFTDKMLMNFLHIGLIRILFPKAPIIHCQREPMDTCWSIFKMDFSRFGHEYASSQEKLAKFYGAYQKLMHHWHGVLPNEIYDVHYEAMVNEQKQQTKDLLERCKLPWDENCLLFHKADRRVSTLSVAQVRQPIYTTAVNKYRSYEAYLTPMTKYFASENAI